MIQTVELTCVQHGEAVPLGIGTLAAGKYDSVVGISACDESAGGIHGRTLGADRRTAEGTRPGCPNGYATAARWNAGRRIRA